MAVQHRRQQALFSTIHSEGANLPMDLLQRIAQNDPEIRGLTPDAYHLTTEKLNEAINHAWNRVLSAWLAFKAAQGRLPEKDTGTTLTRDRWLLPLFKELDYGRLSTAKPIEINDKSYPISHSWQGIPIHLVSFKVDLDHVAKSATATVRSSPHSLLQQLLNRSDDHLWGIVSNGLRLRILRDNVSLTRQAYVEFDLEAMMNGEVYADFVLLWLLCHQSRVEAERPEGCWLEQWSHMAHEQGTRALDQLRNGVEKAIADLGSGFLAYSTNGILREKLRTGNLSAQDYYRQLLRLVYRLIILLVAEERDILFHPDAPQDFRDLYTKYYSTKRLRSLAEQHIGTRHADLFYGLSLVMDKLGEDGGCLELALPALNGFLFSQDAIVDLAGCQIANHALLAAIRSLAFTSTRQTRRLVDYKNLGSEELGSVYESLLELHPVLHIESAKFELATERGNERKTTGSYYTPTSLINSLLDSALDPVLDEACARADPEMAILSLRICDPACGSGHFLVAAAHRTAKRLAAIRSGEEEPAPEARRKALRDVVGHCIYGVDINPMSVELCKVSLWMEAIEPGKPLSFLDAHIQCGNSLLGATPSLLKQGIPDSAFEPIEGDDKKICSEFKKRNKQLRAGQLSLIREDGPVQIWEHQDTLTKATIQLGEMHEDTVEDIHRKQAFFKNLRVSGSYENALLWANAWCAAFVWKKTVEMRPPITHEEFNNIGKNPSTLNPWRKQEIQRLAAQYQFFHWHLAFPDVFCVPAKGETPENEQVGWSGGFDVVLGNTPWEQKELKEQEWFATRNLDVANAAGAERKRKIEALAITDPNLYNAFLEARRQEHGWSHFVRNSERFPFCGRGRINTYAIFAETNRLLLGPRGRVGCIVPSGIATDDTTKFFFQNLMETRSLESLYDFENRDGIFSAVHRSYKFCLLTLTGSSDPAIKGAEFVFFAQKVENLQDSQRYFTLSSDDIKLLNPNTLTCPIFRTRRDAEINKGIYHHIPVLFREVRSKDNSWELAFDQGRFNMTSASHLFYTKEKLEAEGWRLKGNIFSKERELYLPLYEGKMIWHFDHRSSEYSNSSDDFEELNNILHNDAYKLPLPRYWLHESLLPDSIKNENKGFIVLRDIARSTDVRTAITSIVSVVTCGDTLHTIIPYTKEHRKIIYFNSCTSSYIFDYVSRQKVGGTHLKLFHLKQLPVLPPSTYTTICYWDRTATLGDWILPRALELTYTAWDLEPFAKDCGYDRPPFRWDEERRFLLRCELDAAYFHLYGIERDDVGYVMETFPIVKRKDEKQYGDYRTKRVILEIYDEMQQAIESGVPYQTRLDPPPADPAVAHAPRMEE